ncbi:MAG: hypothetical protein HC896_17265 [Bacteroidales bacterium]|nr:hypothetical protein [Bacteroidales bacterium]
MVRRFAAHLVFPVEGKPIKEGIVHVGEEGKIIQVYEFGSHKSEQANMIFYSGIIVPQPVAVQGSAMHEAFELLTGAVPAKVPAFQLPIVVETNESNQLSVLKDWALAYSLPTVLPWFTINAAKYMGKQHLRGSIKPGKAPGLIHVSHFNFLR